LISADRAAIRNGGLGLYDCLTYFTRQLPRAEKTCNVKMLVVMGLTCRSLPGQSISSEASVDGLEACGLSSHIVEDVCSLNLRRKVTNRGHAVVSAVVVCCSFHSAVGERLTGRVGSMYGSVAHLVPCDRRPLLPRHVSLLPASGQRCAEYGWLRRSPVNQITAREGDNHDNLAISSMFNL
jgi:hypothetical protein